MSSNLHNKLIKNAAMTFLKPIGCMQQGRSRTWLDSHPYWVGVVEFQPSSWAKGSYLNVGASWLWHDSGHVTFNEGYRVAQFEAYENDEQFTEASMVLATKARDEVVKLREQFSTLGRIAAHLKNNETVNIWHNYHAAVSAGLVGDVKHALLRFSLIANAPALHPWMEELQERSAKLASLIEDSEGFRGAIDCIVTKQRAHLKL